MTHNATPDDLRFMKIAYDEAKRSFDEQNGIPVGAVLAVGDRELARGHNNRNQLKNRILHGEMDCLKNLELRPLPTGATLYTTLNPCVMCAGAIIQFGIERVVIGQERVTAPRQAAFVGRADMLADHGVEIVMLHNPECEALFAQFLASPKGLEHWLADIGKEFR